MVSNEIETKTTEIVNRFKAVGVSIEEQEVSRRLTLLISEFKVQVPEAVRTVTGFFRQKHGLKFEDLKGTQGPAGQVKVSDLHDDNAWVSLHAKVVQIWDPMNDIIHQTGLVGDETGIVKFTIFAKNAGLGVLEEGKVYALNNFVTSMWQGQLSIKGNKNSSIQEIQEEIETKRRQDVVTGMITYIQQGSGLIKRCPECNRKLLKGMCGEHGKVEGYYDLRIKAVLEPYGSSKTVDLIINREVTEMFTGMTLEQAKTMATEVMDSSVVEQEYARKIPGRYYEVVGGMMPSNNMIVESIKPVNVFTAEKAKAVIEALGGV